MSAPEKSGARASNRARRRVRREERPRRGFEYVEGWGMAAGAKSRVWRPTSSDEVAEALGRVREAGRHVALRGAGRSYGDASINSGGDVLDISGMNRILSFDETTGVADCEGGVTIRDLWRHSLPRGYWPKVVSGTMFPTLAGAAGMNIHGKNNYKVGTIGDAIEEIDVVLPSGECTTLSRDVRPELFHAVIGGFGMLGAITRVKIVTKKIHSGEIDVAGISVPNLRAMMEYVDGQTDAADYLVGWLDCFGHGDSLGRGLIHHARYLEPGEDPEPGRTLKLSHQDLPGSILGFPKGEVWRILRLLCNDPGMRLLNFTKHQMGKLEQRQGWYRQSHAAFNFLLDFVPNWKFAYGRRPGHGLIQYQVFLPKETALDGFTEVLERQQRRGHVSYLGVLKRHRPDPFLLTHGLDGWSMAMDFKVTPRSRESLWATCDELTRVVLERGGRFYFAKDAVIGPKTVESMFDADRLAAFRDMKAELDPDELLQTDLWRRAFASDGAYTASA
ncbi:MAG: FAD-binding oxidoreductase [Planctomycetota bacterium]